MAQKTPHQQRIEQFMRLAKQRVPQLPEMPSEKTRELRAKLIMEEALETIDALGVDVTCGNTYVSKDNVHLFATHPPNLVEIADGCADISVVTIGTLSACGIPDQGLLEMVDKNNLEKRGNGSYIRPDGKLVKPPNHKPPDIRGWLESFN